MKKQVLISSFVAAAILTGTAIYAGTTASAETNREDNVLAAIEASASSLTTTPTFNSGNETVYVIADANGAEKSKFIGNTLYGGTEDLPFNFKITYILNGEEISAENLAGKSGRVKIIFKATSEKKFQNVFIPFVTITGVTLDRSVFSNVAIENGKIISESSDSYTIAGYALTGLNENLNTDLLPDSFSIEADVDNFKLDNTYTILLNDILADLDTSKLSDIDSFINSMSTLSTGIEQILSGAGDLSSGLSTALDGTKTLYAGSKTLATGAETLATGAKTLSTGLNTITENNTALQSGATTVITSTLESLNSNATLMYILSTMGVSSITTDNYSTVLPRVIAYLESISYDTSELTQAKGLLDLSTGIIGYTDAVATAATGASDLSSGLETLSAGTSELSAGLATLVDGETELYNGSITLKNGIETFKSTGIDKIVDFAEKDAKNFLKNFRASITAAGSYKSFGGVDAKSVKFVIKTASI